MYPKSNEDALLLNHVCDTTADMSDPAADWLKVAVENVDGALQVGEQ